MTTNFNEFTTSPTEGLDRARFISFIQGIKKIKKSPLSQRECTCLSWAAVGKTADEIADILNITRHTVHYHTKKAINELDTENKTHAVTKALLMGYISISRKIV